MANKIKTVSKQYREHLFSRGIHCAKYGNYLLVRVSHCTNFGNFPSKGLDIISYKDQQFDLDL